MAMAMLRQDEAVEFLLARLNEDAEKPAAHALAALSLYVRDESLCERILEAVTRRENAALLNAFERDFRRQPGV